MQHEGIEQKHADQGLKEERRLVGTMITGRPSTLAFIVAFAIVLWTSFMTVLYWVLPSSAAALMPTVYSQVFAHGQIWRVFTAIFVHADLEHFLSNMYMLWIFSFITVGYFGLKIFPYISLVLAGVVNALTILTYSPTVELIGASGLVYILGGFWLTMYFFIQRQYTITNRLIRVLGISFVIFFPTSFVPTTSYTAHAIGFLAGVIMAGIYFVQNKKNIREREVYKISYV